MQRDWRIWLHPIVLATVLTFANAMKPVLIDDTAYLTFAKHLLSNPANPYGFEIFWQDQPQPAMQIVMPPVLPYWLALGMALLGNDLVLLKLWLFPFALILSYSIRSLARVFAPDQSEVLSLIVCWGPGCLICFNFMLDLPALALGLASVALALWGGGKFLPWGFLSSAALALALQTKYSVLGYPAVIVLLSFTRGQLRFGLRIVALSMLFFISWEFFVLAIHGSSHFLVHLFGYGQSTVAHAKVSVLVGLFGHLGLTACWIGPAFLRAQRWIVPLAITGLLTILAIVLVPGSNQILAAMFMTLGFGACFAVLPHADRIDRWETRFLLGWLLIEVGIYLAISPFPAARRTLGIAVVLTLLVASRMRIRAASLILNFALALSGFLIDWIDARAEQAIPRQVIDFAIEQNLSGQGYFIGHWGFQYYAQSHGLELIDPATTAFLPGDWLILPTTDRPDTGGFQVVADPQCMTLIREFIVEDRLQLQTVSGLYAGRMPITVRNGPRLRYLMYQVTTACRPTIVGK